MNLAFALFRRGLSHLFTVSFKYHFWVEVYCLVIGGYFLLTYHLNINIIFHGREIIDVLIIYARIIDIYSFRLIHLFIVLNIAMFDELLSQLDDALTEAKSLKGPSRSQADSAIDTSALGCDITKPFASVATFGKQQRFKPPVKQDLKTIHVEWERPSQKQPAGGYSFKKIQRFQDSKPRYNETYINPSIAPIKKNTTNNVPIFKKSQGKDLAKSNVSISTVASDSLRGPGLYKIKDESKVKNGAFMKDNRFKREKNSYEDNPLFINESQTRKRPPSSTVMKNKSTKTKQLITREQQEDLREKLKLVYWKNIPLEFDRLFKNNRGAIIREDYFNLNRLTGVHRRGAILMMINRLNYLRGGYEQDIRAQMEAACAVAYRKSTPKPFKFSEMDPGPDYYYPTDDLIRENPVAFSFGRAGMVQKKEEGDYRDYQINDQIFKKGGNIVINPLPSQQHRLTEEEIRSLERGPGFYDCLFSQVEKRNDVGIVKFQEITQKNDRQNNCIEKKEVNDGVYFPSYKAIDPNIPAPLYKEPAKIKLDHLPDKILFPEHWLFYDGDLNKVRAEIAKNVILAKNMSFQEYQIYRERFQNFKEYLQLERKGPEVGEYTVKYDVIDPHVPVVDMARQEEKTLIDPIVKPEGHSPGDNLILNPKPLEDHLPNIDMQKIVGREDPEIDRTGEPNEGDRLILNPQKPEKHVPQVDFKKFEGRPEGQQYDENYEGPQGDVLIIDPKPVEKHIGNIDFAKQAERPEIVTQQNELQEVIPINIPDQKVIKGAPFSRLSSVRLVPILRSQMKSHER